MLKTITFATTQMERDALAQLCRAGKFRNRSAAIRAALLLLFEAQGMKPDALREIRFSRRGGTRHRSY